MNNFTLHDGQLIFGGSELKAIENIYIENDRIPDYVASFQPKFTMSAEATFECEINTPLFEKLFGVDLAKGVSQSFALECKAPYKVQKKRHKKWRTNKKWAKRYGYITKFKDIRITDISLITDQSNPDELCFVGQPHSFVIS